MAGRASSQEAASLMMEMPSSDGLRVGAGILAGDGGGTEAAGTGAGTVAAGAGAGEGAGGGADDGGGSDEDPLVDEG